MMKAHSGLSGAHFGVVRTLQRLRKECFWQGMTKDLRKYVRDCMKCQQSKATVSKSQGHVQVFDDGELFEPWTVVHIDHVTNLPMTTQGCKHVLTATCRMTHAT